MSRRLAAGFLIGAILLVAGCEDESTPVRTVEPPGGRPGLPSPDQVVENGQHVITVEGVKKAVITAEQLFFYNRTGKVYGDTIEVQFFDESGFPLSTLTAKTGELDQTTQEMIARGDVFMRGREATIRSEELHYDPRADEVSSDEPTQINQRGNVVRGQGVVSDTGLRDIRIRGGSAVLRSDPERQPQSNADERKSRGTDGPTAAEVAPPDTGVARPPAEDRAPNDST